MELVPATVGRQAPVKKTTFAFIPHLAREKIFQHFDKKSLSRARGVCIDWALWLKANKGVYLVISNSNWKYLMSVPEYGPEVTEMTLENWTWARPQTFRLTRFLKTLEVTGRMSSFSLLEFLAHCDVLEHLTFTFVQFERFLPTDFELNGRTFKPRTQLKSLRINTDGDEWLLTKADVFILKFIKYYNLKDLSSFILCRENSTISTDCDYSIVGKRNREVNLDGIVRLDETERILNTITRIIQRSMLNLKILHLESTAELIFDLNFLERMPKLEELTGVMRYRDGWGLLLGAQTTLTVLRVEFFDFNWRDIKGCIRACAGTLKELKLIGFSGMLWGHEINFHFLNCLTKLKTLHLELLEGLIAVHHFPASLESLCLDGPFSRADFESMTFGFTNLKRFCLRNYGHDLPEVDLFNHIPSDIFDVEQFMVLVQAPKMQKIVFQHSMMYRMDIIDFCKTNGISVKSQCATVDGNTIGYLYNLEATIPRSNKTNK